MCMGHANEAMSNCKDMFVKHGQGDVLLPSFCGGYSSRASVFGKISALNMEILNTSEIGTGCKSKGRKPHRLLVDSD